MSYQSPVKQTKRAGRPRLVIDFFYLDELGTRRRYRRDAHTGTMSAARAEAQRLIDLAARTGSPFESMQVMKTFGAFVEEVYRPLFMRRLRPGTRERYEGIFRQGVMAHFASMPLDAIGAVEVLRYTAKLEQRRRTHTLNRKSRGIEPRGHGDLVRAVLRAAVAARELATMPVLPRFPESAKLPSAPPEQHVTALLGAAPRGLRLTVALCALAGLRQGEMRALQVGDIDFEERLIWVRRAYSADELVAPKGNRERVVPMIPELEQILREAVVGKPARALLVSDERCKPLPRQRLLAQLKAFEKRSGLAEWGWHALRHHFCSQLARKGASLEAIRVLAGHGSVRTTERYLHVTRQDLRDAVAKLSRNAGSTVPRRLGGGRAPAR